MEKMMRQPTPQSNNPTAIRSGYSQPTATPTPQDTYSGYRQVRPQDDISNLVLQASQETGISPLIIAAMLFTESGYNPQAVNKNDRGIAQINRRAYPKITDTQAYDPTFAIPFLAKTVKSDLDYFGGDMSRAIAAYNVGRGGASVKGPAKYGGGPKGQAYLDKVAKNLEDDYVRKFGLMASYL